MAQYYRQASKDIYVQLENLGLQHKYKFTSVHKESAGGRGANFFWCTRVKERQSVSDGHKRAQMTSRQVNQSGWRGGSLSA